MLRQLRDPWFGSHDETISVETGFDGSDSIVQTKSLGCTAGKQPPSFLRRRNRTGSARDGVHLERLGGLKAGNGDMGHERIVPCSNAAAQSNGYTGSTMSDIVH